MFILHCGHVLEARKNGGCAGLYGQCSKGVAFLPETRFLTVLFCFLRFLVPVPHFGPPVTRFAGVDIDAENAFTAPISLSFCYC